MTCFQFVKLVHSDKLLHLHSLHDIYVYIYIVNLSATASHGDVFVET